MASQDYHDRMATSDDRKSYGIRVHSSGPNPREISWRVVNRFIYSEIGTKKGADTMSVFDKVHP
jgi:hypothetical protein